MLARNDSEPDVPAERPEPADVPAEADLDELAKKVFELLLQELELENDRTGK